MATNRSRRTRKIRESIPLDESIENFFLTGEVERGTAAWDLHVSRFFDGGERRQAAWSEYREFLLSKWVNKNPCSRPWGWWKFEAEKELVNGWEYDHFNSAQRKRMGGIGTPAHEALCVWGGFNKGIPASWISKREEDYYNGRALDIHGNPTGTEYKEGHFKGKAIDPDDPPQFESEAAFLLRKDLLSESEKKVLAKHPEFLRPETITIDLNDLTK